MTKEQKLKEYPNPHPAYNSANTLDPDVLGTHDCGWTITGEVHEDYYEWVNYFEATHPTLGKVVGDFEDSTLQATSKKALNHFCKHFSPTSWDYEDI